MSARLRKEFALLGPTFWLALALAALPPILLLWVPGENQDWDASQIGLSCLCFSAGMVLLSVASFGREFNHRTISLLLSQPMGRGRLWLEKTGLLCVLALIVLCVFLFSEWIAGAFAPGFGIGLRIPGTDIVWIAVLAVAGALWTTVFFRNAIASLWFTVLIPVALLALVELFGRDTDSDHLESVREIILGIYVFAGVILSAWLFVRTEDTARLGQEITLRLGWPGARATAADASKRTPATPFVALMRKEVHLHQIPLMVFASGAVVLVVLAFGIRWFGQTHAYRQQYDWLEAGWCVVMVGLISPLLGSMTIAEERKLGTADAQQCLPVSRVRQFVVKWLAAHALGVALGYFAARMLASVLLWIAGPEGGLAGLDSNFWHVSLFYSLAGVTVGMYGSSLARNTLGALGITIGLGVLVYGVLLLAYVSVPFQSNIVTANYLLAHLWSPKLFFFITVPALVLFFWRMAFVNFGVWNSPERMWLSNLSALFTLVGGVCVISSLVYNRVWELAVRLEPRQGVARLAPSADIELCAFGYHDAFVLEADGRLRLLTAMPVPTGRANFRWQNLAPIEAGSNWSTVSYAGGATGVGIRSDGSLWRISKNLVRGGPAAGGKWIAQINTIRIGADFGWRAVAAGSRHLLALKENGTLWAATNNTSAQYGSGWTEGVGTILPAQIGTDSDWAQVFVLSDLCVAVKRDGSTWAWGQWPGKVGLEAISANPVRLGSAYNGPWRSLSLGWDWIIATRADGTLWVWNESVVDAKGQAPIRLGSESDWKSAATGWGWGVVCALKTDGTLWKYQPRAGKPDKLTRLSQYSTWVSLDSDTQSVVALARDGTVCCWNGENGLELIYLPGNLLAPTRKALFLGNIFAPSQVLKGQGS